MGPSLSVRGEPTFRIHQDIAQNWTVCEACCEDCVESYGLNYCSKCKYKMSCFLFVVLNTDYVRCSCDSFEIVAGT